VHFSGPGSLALRPALDDTDVPPCPALDGPDVELWRDDAGGIAGYAVAVDHSHWIVIPRIGTFWFADRPDEAIVEAEPGVDPAVLHDLYLRIVLPAALQALGRESLHASAVMSRHGVLAFCGSSGAGKSTLAFALEQQGYAGWADDSIVFEPCDERVLVVPTPFHVRLRPEARSFFGATGQLPSGDARDANPSMPLRSVFLLERLELSADQPHLEVRRVSRTEAFVETLRHANCFSLKDPEQKRRVMRNYLTLVARVPVFRLRYASGLERLSEVVEAFPSAIEHLLEQAT